MEIEFVIKRIFLAKTYTIGRLWLNDVKICDTLEDRVRDYNKDGDLLDAGETKIFGETAIPYGRRKVIVTYSPKFKRELPLITDVMHFTAIRMHSGVHNGHTLGCVLVGENTEVGKLSNGRHWENIVTASIKKYIAQGNDVFINIV